MAKLPLTNFAHLAQHDEQLLRLGLLAEKYFADDPNTCLLKLRQLSEVLAQLVAAKTGQLLAPEETQYDLLRRLQDSGVVPREVAQGELNSLPIALPPQSEILKIVRRVESLFSYADRLEARYAAARAQVEKLTPATLAKAFRGELVPQDPNDEPASALLERIRAQRDGQATAKPKRGRKIATISES